MARDAEEECGTRTSKESSLTSSDGTSSHPQQQQQLNSDHMDNIAPLLPTDISMLQSKQHMTPFMCSAPAFGTHESIFPMELLPQPRAFRPVHHHGQQMNDQLMMSTNPQQNVIVPIIKPTVMVNPYKAAGTNTNRYQTSNVPPNFGIQPRSSGPQVQNETFPPSLVSQLAEKQRHYQQMNDFNSCGPQQAEACPNFLIPATPNPMQLFDWFDHNHKNGSDQDSNHPRRFNNSLYDPEFETMGLPVDPHLRCFLASMNETKAAGSKTNSPK